MLMTHNVLLNNVDHKDLRVITTRSAQYGDDVMYAITFPSEFRNIQAHYPIVFRKNAQGQFEPIALLGFQERKNLFLTRHGWDATYIPLTTERLPFLIGFSADKQPMMHVDLDSPRISRTEGEALFREHGGNTDFLERMNSVLLAIHQGIAGVQPFVAALMEHELLESFVLDVQLANGSQNRLVGFYTINEERLLGLNSTVLERFNRAGYLQAIHMAIASLSQFRALIERMNKRNAGEL
jgi:hypothetical protein